MNDLSVFLFGRIWEYKLIERYGWKFLSMCFFGYFISERECGWSFDLENILIVMENGYVFV